MEEQAHSIEFWCGSSRIGLAGALGRLPGDVHAWITQHADSISNTLQQPRDEP